jgi:hypothetical protein
MNHTAFMVTTVALALTACGGAPHAGPAASPPTSPLELYPMQAGAAWAYDVRAEGDDVPTLVVTRVLRVTGSQIEVTSGTDVVTYDRRPDGIYRLNTGTYLLKSPLTVGSQWRSSLALTASIRRVDSTIKTAAGTFRGCVEVVESGDTDKQVTTVYCPKVGPVRVESKLTRAPRSSDEPRRVVAELRGFQLESSDEGGTPTATPPK